MADKKHCIPLYVQELMYTRDHADMDGEPELPQWLFYRAIERKAERTGIRCYSFGEVCDHEVLRAPMDRSILRWEIAGIPFVVGLGSALHFAFAWSGYWCPLAIMAAVNESVWEHLKLAFWPSLLWAFIEYRVLKVEAWSFWAAKGFALLLAPILIVIIFYGYATLLGRNIIALDVATFVIAITAGQLASAELVKANLQAVSLRLIGIGFLLCQLAAYSAFTFSPPALRLFEDPRNGIRGIPPVNTPSALGTHGAAFP